MNSVILVGRLTRDPELRTTANGTSVCGFSLAVQRPRSWKNSDFINCVAWSQSGEFLSRNFKKGDNVAIAGYLTSRSYQDKDGNKRMAFEVVVEQVEFASNKSDSKPSTATQDSGYTEISPDEDLPF